MSWPECLRFAAVILPVTPVHVHGSLSNCQMPPCLCQGTHDDEGKVSMKY